MKASTETRHFSLIRPRDDAHEAVYHAYWIVASPSEARGSAIATIVVLTEDSPAPESLHVPVRSGGVKAALDQAEERVKDLPGNEGLRRWPPPE